MAKKAENKRWVANNSQRPLLHISLAHKCTTDLTQSTEWLLRGPADSDIFVLWAPLMRCLPQKQRIWLMPLLLRPLIGWNQPAPNLFCSPLGSRCELTNETWRKATFNNNKQPIKAHLGAAFKFNYNLASVNLWTLFGLSTCYHMLTSIYKFGAR